MPRPIPVAGTPSILFLAAFVVLWTAWCFIAVQILVPMVEQHLVVYNGFAAWFLCILPLIAVAVFLVLRLMKDDQ